MRVLILAGGKGTRLSEETTHQPKPMVLIGEKPILWHLLTVIKHNNFRDVTVLLGYKGNVIRNYIRSLHHDGIDVRVDMSTGTVTNLDILLKSELHGINVETLDTGIESFTAKRLKIAIETYKDENEFLVVYGDCLGNIDFKELISFHRVGGKIATVTAVHPIARFGHLSIAGDAVAAFEEKNQINEGWINGGFFVLDRRVLDYIPDDEPFEGNPLQNLASDNQLAAFKHGGFWKPIDTLNDKNNIEKLIENGQRPWLQDLGRE